MNLHLSSFTDLFGHEHDSGQVHRELKFAALGAGAGAVGAIIQSCSDESLNETADRFERGFARETLPAIKPGVRAPFRLHTPGGIYPWGAARVAIGNFATADLGDGFLLMVTKVESHCAVDRTGQGVRFGRKRRYAREGVFCGALNALLEGRRAPLIEEFERAFTAEGVDRLAVVRAAPEEERLLLTAVTSARLMARNIAMDLQDFAAPVPVVHLILHGVVLNQYGADTELIGGAYLLDRRGGHDRDRYRGIGDDPARYVVEAVPGPIRVTDDSIDQERDARDHRALATHHASRHHVPHDPRLAELHAKIERTRPDSSPWGRTLLRASLFLLAEVAPVPTALFLLGEGAVDIFHAHRLSRAAATAEESDDRTHDARGSIADAHERLNELDDAEAAALAARLIRKVGAKIPGGHHSGSR